MMGPRDVLNGFKFRDCSCNEVGNGSGGGGLTIIERDRHSVRGRYLYVTCFHKLRMVYLMKP